MHPCEQSLLIIFKWFNYSFNNYNSWSFQLFLCAIIPHKMIHTDNSVRSNYETVHKKEVHSCNMVIIILQMNSSIQIGTFTFLTSLDMTSINDNDYFVRIVFVNLFLHFLICLVSMLIFIKIFIYIPSLWDNNDNNCIWNLIRKINKLIIGLDDNKQTHFSIEYISHRLTSSLLRCFLFLLILLLSYYY